MGKGDGTRTTVFKEWPLLNIFTHIGVQFAERYALYEIIVFHHAYISAWRQLFFVNILNITSKIVTMIITYLAVDFRVVTIRVTRLFRINRTLLRLRPKDYKHVMLLSENDNDHTSNKENV